MWDRCGSSPRGGPAGPPRYRGPRGSAMPTFFGPCRSYRPVNVHITAPERAPPGAFGKKRHLMKSYSSAVKNDLHVALRCVSRLPAVAGASSGASRATDRNALDRLLDATSLPRHPWTTAPPSSSGRETELSNQLAGRRRPREAGVLQLEGAAAPPSDRTGTATSMAAPGEVIHCGRPLLRTHGNTAPPSRSQPGMPRPPLNTNHPRGSPTGPVHTQFRTGAHLPATA